MDKETEQQEKEKLLKIEVNDPGAIVSRPTWRHVLIIPITNFCLIGLILSNFVLNEWTQYVVKEMFFSNVTIENNATCGVMNKTDVNYERYETVQRHTARWLVIYNLTANIPAILATIILSSYTDAFGRKFLIILSLAGMLIYSLTKTLTIYYTASFWYVIAANIVYGFSGSIFAVFSASFAFIADITVTESQRSVAIVTLEASFMFCEVLSSYLSGYFIETLKLGFFKTSLIALVLTGTGFLMTVALPESFPKQHRRKPKNILVTCKEMTDFYISYEYKGKRLGYVLLLLAFAFSIQSGLNRGTMETLYFLGRPFCWGPSKIGIFIMIRNAATCLGGLGSVKLLQFCMSNVAIAIFSCFSGALSLTLEAFANTDLLIYVMVPTVGMFSFLVIPMIRGLMSSLTAADKQGSMFAGVATVESLSSLVASLSENAIYSVTLSFMAGFVFLVMAFYSLVGMFLVIIYKCTKPSNNMDVQYVTVQENKTERNLVDVAED